MELAKFLEGHYPELRGKIEGGIYPPSKTAQIVSSFTGYAWFGGIALMLGGKAIFDAMGLPEPEFVSAMRNNQMMTVVGLFMLNNFGNSMLATGAFEIYLDGDLVFSKLQSKRFPDADDIYAFMGQPRM